MYRSRLSLVVGMLFLCTPPGGELAAQKSVWKNRATLQLLHEKGAGEGPAWHPDVGLVASHGSVYLFRQGAPPEIYKKDLGTNGLLWDDRGRLWCCQPSMQRVIRFEQDGTLSLITDRFNDAPYNQPNDITVDGDGRVYFSDPKYGPYEDLPQKDGQGRPVEGVYMIDTRGEVTRVITHEVDRPNGVLVSRDQKYLYVAGNNNNNQGGERALFRFQRMDCCGSILLSSQKLIYDWGNGRGPDGLVQDVRGNLYVAGGLNRDDAVFETNEHPGGVYVFSPQGELIDFVAVPKDEVTNCTFGGNDLKTLYVTAGGSLFSIRTRNRGWLPATARR